MHSCRRASHASTWYESNGQVLKGQLESWMANGTGATDVLAVISPHAGYRYSGSTAGQSFAALRKSFPERVETVLVLGPSHYATLSNKCGLTPADQLETPCGELEVDVARRDTLLDGSHKSHFVSLSVDADEREHSLEMQFPFIKQVYPHAKVLPIMVGRLNDTTRGEIAASLLGCLPDLQMGRVAIVISSDFCHWGARFGYYGPASNSDEIRKLDMLGFDGLNAPSSVQFQDYLQRTGNTICGREAILLFLEMVERSALATTQWTLLGYSQSNTVSSPSDSSVSYLSASLSIIILK